MRLILAWLISYLIGSLPTGYMVGRLVAGTDIRNSGSGNIGATNVARLLGKKWGAVVLCVDVLKGLIPVALLPGVFGLERGGSGLVEISIGAAAVLGHCFSVFLRFRGGKGVATGIGVFLAIAPMQIILLLLVGLGLIAWKGYVSLASVVCAGLLPFFLYFAGQPLAVLVIAELLCAVVILRHWPNMVRLLRHEERAIWDPEPRSDEDAAIPTIES